MQYPAPITLETEALNDSDEACINAVGVPATDPPERDDGIPRARVQRIARRFTSKALRTLIRGMDSPDDRVRIAAASQMLDRGWGKAPATLEVRKPSAAMSDAELQAELQRRLAALAERYGPDPVVIVPAVPMTAETV